MNRSNKLKNNENSTLQPFEVFDLGDIGVPQNNCLRILSNGYLVLFCERFTYQEIRIYDLNQKKLIDTIPLAFSAYSMLPLSRARLAFSDRNGLSIWDASTKKITKINDFHVINMSQIGDSDQLNCTVSIQGSKHTEIVNLSSSKKVEIKSSPQKDRDLTDLQKLVSQNNLKPYQSVEFLSDTKCITRHRGGDIIYWDLASSKLLEKISVGEICWAMALSSDLKLFCFVQNRIERNEVPSRFRSSIACVDFGLALRKEFKEISEAVDAAVPSFPLALSELTTEYAVGSRATMFSKGSKSKLQQDEATPDDEIDEEPPKP